MVDYYILLLLYIRVKSIVLSRHKNIGHFARTLAQNDGYFIGIPIWFPNILLEAHWQYRHTSNIHSRVGYSSRTKVEIFSFSFVLNRNKFGTKIKVSAFITLLKDKMETSQVMTAVRKIESPYWKWFMYYLSSDSWRKNIGIGNGTSDP